MNFCNKCGNKVSSEQKFCNKCGTRLEFLSKSNQEDIRSEIKNNEEIEVLQHSEKIEPISKDNEKIEPISKDSEKIESVPKGEKVDVAQKSEKIKVSQNNKNNKVFMLVGIIISVIIAVFLGAKAGLTNYYSPKNIVIRFQEAVIEGNVDRIKSMLYSKNQSLEIDDIGVKALIKLLQEDDIAFGKLKDNLSEDISNSYKLIFKGSPELLGSKELLGLTIASENFLFTKYALMVEHDSLEIKANISSGDIFIDEQEIQSIIFDEEDKDIGKFIPGIYDITLKSKDLLNNEISDTRSIGTSNLYIHENPVFFDEYEMYSISSNIPEATIFINDVDTNILVKDTEDQFGPISEDDVIVAKYVINDKIYTSKIAAPSWMNRSRLIVDFERSDYYEIQDYLDNEVALELATNSAKSYIEKYKNKDFIIPDSNSRNLVFKDLNDYNAEELFIAHNEILARNGQVFKNQPVLQKYFESKSWYKANSSFNGELTNEFEKNNHNNLKTIEFMLLAKESCSPIQNSYVFTDSDKREIKSYELSYLSDWEIIIARNEIFARYGLEFSTKDLIEYFKTKSWFKIDTSVDNNVALSEVERKNVQTILKEEITRIDNTLNHDLGE